MVGRYLCTSSTELKYPTDPTNKTLGLRKSQSDDWPFGSKMSTSMSLSLRRAAGASTLFKILSPKSPFTAAPSSVTRFFSSDSSSQEPIMVKGAPQEFKMENPFQSAGPKEVLEVDTVKEGILVRVAMPGVSEDGIKVWLENNTVFFTGKGDIEVENEESGRKYGGSLEFSTDCCKADKVEAEMKNGILRMVVKGEMGQD